MELRSTEFAMHSHPELTERRGFGVCGIQNFQTAKFRITNELRTNKDSIQWVARQEDADLKPG